MSINCEEVIFQFPYKFAAKYNYAIYRFWDFTIVCGLFKTYNCFTYHSIFSCTYFTFDFSLLYLKISYVRNDFTLIKSHQPLLLPIFKKYFLHLIVYIPWDTFYVSWYHWMQATTNIQSFFIVNKKMSLFIFSFLFWF